MVFWKKDCSKDIRKNLRKIRRYVHDLKRFETKVHKTISVIDTIKEKIDDASREIRERADEEKAKPYIDLIYDRYIDAMANEEIKHLQKIKKDLDDYRELIEEAKKTEELDEVIDLLEEEEKAIVEREKHHERKLKEFENATLRKRLATTSFPPPQWRTRDGTRFADVARVARQLGGWVQEASGSHPAQILFPHAARPIPFSRDAGVNLMAKGIRTQLLRFFPTHKIPTVSKLETALKAGDIHRAA